MAVDPGFNENVKFLLAIGAAIAAAAASFGVSSAQLSAFKERQDRTVEEFRDDISILETTNGQQIAEIARLQERVRIIAEELRIEQTRVRRLEEVTVRGQ